MARRRDPARFSRLVEAGIQAFVGARSLQRVQMEEVARLLGVSKGTLYLYVESKEALFDLCLQHADAEGSSGRLELEEPATLPVPTPAPEETLAKLSARIEGQGRMPTLEEAAASDRPATREELRAVVVEIHRVLAANKTAFRIVNGAARDVPALAELWYEQTRLPLLSRLERYLRKAAAAGVVRPSARPDLQARLLVESAVWMAVHRHFDARPLEATEAEIEALLVETLLDGMARPETLSEEPTTEERDHA